MTKIQAATLIAALLAILLNSIALALDKEVNVCKNRDAHLCASFLR